MNDIYNFLILTITSLHNTMFTIETDVGTTYKVPPTSHIKLFYKKQKKIMNHLYIKKSHICQIYFYLIVILLIDNILIDMPKACH